MVIVKIWAVEDAGSQSPVPALMLSRSALTCSSLHCHREDATRHTLLKMHCVWVSPRCHPSSDTGSVNNGCTSKDLTSCQAQSEVNQDKGEPQLQSLPQVAKFFGQKSKMCPISLLPLQSLLPLFSSVASILYTSLLGFTLTAKLN